MTGVICVLAVLMLSTSGVLAEKKLKKGTKYKIEFDDKDAKVLEFTIGENGDIVDDKGNALGEEVHMVPNGADLILSIHHKNPCFVQINNRPPRKVDC